MKCQICFKKFKFCLSLAKHIFHSHKNITREQYYNKYIKKKNPICRCGKRKRFRGLGEGYRDYCSIKCRDKYVKHICYWEGKKMPLYIIKKRVKHTNYKKCKITRRKTMLRKYGVVNPMQIPRVKKIVSLKKKGKKLPRTKEWQRKICESKKRNGTNFHSEETKIKMGKAIKKTLNSPFFDKSVFCKKQSGGISGEYKKCFLEVL